jgi:hypothetical protein
MGNTPHDVGKTTDPRSGGDKPQPPNPSKVEPGSKDPAIRDKGDKTQPSTGHDND